MRWYFCSWSNFGCTGLLSASAEPYLWTLLVPGETEGHCWWPFSNQRRCCTEEVSGYLKAKASLERCRAHVYRWISSVQWWGAGKCGCQPLKSKAGSCKTSCVWKSKQKSRRKKEQSPEVKLFQLEPVQHSILTTFNTYNVQHLQLSILKGAYKKDGDRLFSSACRGTRIMVLHWKRVDSD